jgi:hypothetical protein
MLISLRCRSHRGSDLRFLTSSWLGVGRDAPTLLTGVNQSE